MEFASHPVTYVENIGVLFMVLDGPPPLPLQHYHSLRTGCRGCRAL